MTVAAAAPQVKWAQRAEKVFVTILLGDVTEEKFKIDASCVSFAGTSGGKAYAIDIALYEDILPLPEDSTHKNTGGHVFFELKKKEPGPFWPRLLKDKAKHQNIKVDFERWKDEDDTDDEEQMGPGGGQRYDDASLEDMMQQMGTGGGEGFDPDEGCSDDSDDDDLPELEGENGAKINGDSWREIDG